MQAWKLQNWFFSKQGRLWGTYSLIFLALCKNLKIGLLYTILADYLGTDSNLEKGFLFLILSLLGPIYWFSEIGHHSNLSDNRA